MAAKQERDEYQRALDNLEELRENGGVTISGRIYRFLTPEDSSFQVGRQITEIVGKVEEFVDEDYVGRNYGSGRFKVRYLIKKDGEAKGEETTLIYNIGKEYDKFKKQPSNPIEPERGTEAANAQTPRSGFLENFLNGLTPEKITAFGIGIKALKELFAPPPPPPAPDMVELLKVFAALREPQKPALSDTIVMSAMESMKQQNKQPSILQQLRDLKTIKEELKENFDEEKEEEEKGDEMNLMLKTALEYLQMFLQKNNNNFQAVGAQAAENPMIKNLVSNDPELAQCFFKKAKEQYGIDNAKKLALGFGYNLEEAPQQIDAGEEEETLENG